MTETTQTQFIAEALEDIEAGSLDSWYEIVCRVYGVSAGECQVALERDLLGCAITDLGRAEESDRLNRLETEIRAFRSREASAEAEENWSWSRSDRGDAHRPSNIDPSQYDYVGGFVTDPPVGFEGELMVDEEYLSVHEPFADGRPWHDLLSAAYSPDRAYPYSNEKGPVWYGYTERCDHCGAYIKYVAVYRHRPSGQFIAAGHDCSDNTFGWADRRSLELARQKKAMDAARKNLAEETERRASLEATTALFPEAVEILTGYEGRNSFIRDVASRFAQFGTVKRIQDGDYSAQEKVMVAIVKASQRDAERDAERTEAQDVPSGRTVVEGEVVKVAEQENDYGVRLVMTVKDDRGFLVWGTVPSALRDVTVRTWVDERDGSNRREYRDIEKGDRVQFTAGLTPSGRDPKFGFFKRPSKASVLEMAPPAEEEAPQDPATSQEAQETPLEGTQDSDREIGPREQGVIDLKDDYIEFKANNGATQEEAERGYLRARSAAWERDIEDRRQR